MSPTTRTALAAVVLLGIVAIGWYLYADYAPASLPGPDASSEVSTTPITNPFGTVTDVSDASFTLEGPDGKTLTVHTTSETVYTTGLSTEPAGGVEAGDYASIASSTPRSDGSVTAHVIILIPPPPPPPPPAAQQ